MVKKVSLAVMSDLHCHPEKALTVSETFLYSDMRAIPVNQNPIESLLNLIGSEKISAEALLVPGDLTNRHNQAGIGAAWDYSSRVQKALKAKHLIGTVGNHDVDSYSAPPSPDIFSLAKNFRTNFPYLNKKTCTDFWGKGFCFVETAHFNILVLNSVALHSNPDEAKRGAIVDSGLESLDMI